MILEELKLDGDVAVLIGRKKDSFVALASALAEAGASLVIAGPLGEVLNSALQKALDYGVRAASMVIDPASPIDMARLARKTLSDFGHIDILVNDAEVALTKPIETLTQAEWQQLLEADLTSLFLSSKILGAHLTAQRSGRIVNVVSGLIERGIPNGTAYCAVMGGVSQLSRALALEWAPHNVRVNTIGIGWTEDTVMKESVDSIRRYIPLGRLCRPEDVAPLAIFLASRASSYITGYTYYVDGGLMARG
jgi:NAD(P)-dependent dehydrogenase (short-subunit alcohol dehydrogenase family)